MLHVMKGRGGPPDHPYKSYCRETLAHLTPSGEPVNRGVPRPMRAVFCGYGLETGKGGGDGGSGTGGAPGMDGGVAIHRIANIIVETISALPMNLVIDTRVLNSRDIDLLRSIVELFAREFEESPDPLAPRADDGYLARLLARESFVAIAALADGVVVGGITGHVLPKTGEARSELYLYDLAVASDWRRRGIATAMIERLKDVAREKDAHVIFVQADVGDAPAIELYSRYSARRDVLHFEIPCD